MNDVVRKFELALEPLHPTLALSITSGVPEVTARVYPDATKNHEYDEFLLTPSVALLHLPKAAHLSLNDDGVDFEVFKVALTDLEQASHPQRLTCKLSDAIDFMVSELHRNGNVEVTIGEAHWLVQVDNISRSSVIG